MDEDCGEDLKSLDWLQNFDLAGQLGFSDFPFLLPFTGASETTTAQILPPTSSRQKSVNNKNGIFVISKVEDKEKSLSPKEENKPPRPAGSARATDRRQFCQCTISCLIFHAIEESAQKALPLQGIYEWIISKYPEFQQRNCQWRRSVRHSLSLNKCFVRLQQVRGVEYGSRGCWWTVHPDFRKSYSSTVMAQGPQHRCLPRNHDKGNWPELKHYAESEIELMELAQDIKVAASIVALNPAPPKTRKRITTSTDLDNYSSSASKDSAVAGGRRKKRPREEGATRTPSPTESLQSNPGNAIPKKSSSAAAKCKKKREIVISMGRIKEDHCYDEQFTVDMGGVTKLEKDEDIDILE